MQVLYDLDSFPASLQGAAVSIGKFDGIHLGHALIIHRLKTHAGKLNAPSIILTFDPPPVSILRPDLAYKPICSPLRKIELVKSFHVDAMIVCRTTRDFLEQSAETFFYQTLRDRMHARIIVEGNNFTFGRDRVGDSETIRHYGNWTGIDIDIVQPVRLGDRIVSSSGIRRLLHEGKIEQANELLSQPFQLSGQVDHGERRGRTLGFPTANLIGIETIVPKPGVYACVARIGRQRYAATTHLGSNPTFDGDQVKIEVFLHHFQGDLYGKRMNIDFHANLREVTRFDSKDQLIEQMHRDVRRSEEILASLPTTADLPNHS